MRFALLLLLLPSCVVMHEADSDGSKATYASLGGKGAYRRGVGVIHDHNQSFRDAAIAAATVAGSAFSAATAAEQELSTRTATQATEQTKVATEAEATKRLIDNNATQVKLAELGTTTP